jgi:hypothetical protein
MDSLNMMKTLKFTAFIVLAAALIALTGCSGGEGTLADYFGWPSFGGTWRGDLHLTDGREPAVIMTFTEFDGDSFHVVLEASISTSYERIEGDGEYIDKTKYIKYYVNPFLGGECWVNGQIYKEPDKYVIHGNVELHVGASTVFGFYDVLYTP